MEAILQREKCRVRVRLAGALLPLKNGRARKFRPENKLSLLVSGNHLL
jgi:hypothetical protein